MRSIIFAFLPTLSFGALTSANQNDVADGGACKAMTVLFARGTTELGNMGSVAGPPFVSAIGAMMGGDVAVQGIEYPADIPGFLAGGDKGGSTLMAQMVGQVRAKCPDTNLVMAGYSYVTDLLCLQVLTDGSVDKVVNSSTMPLICFPHKTRLSSAARSFSVTQITVTLLERCLLPTLWSCATPVILFVRVRL
jgi:hypothetical protein